MSFKAKDLQYESNEPAFLRRLRGNISSSTDDPDRRSTAAAGRGFARKSKRPGDDDDDAPTYVLEGSEATLSKSEAEALLKPADVTEIKSTEGVVGHDGGTPKSDPSAEAKTDRDSTAARPLQQVADAGLQSKKRKAVKVVGDEHEDVQRDEAPTGTGNSMKAKAKTKKKAKVVKLQLDD